VDLISIEVFGIGEKEVIKIATARDVSERSGLIVSRSPVSALLYFYPVKNTFPSAKVSSIFLACLAGEKCFALLQLICFWERSGQTVSMQGRHAGDLASP
jgi:hypothetical protein